jgi:hypothetical protein
MRKVLLFVHGAGKQDSDYAVDPLAAIALLLGSEPPCVPVYYADIANIGSPVGIESISGAALPPTAAEPPEVTQFKIAFARAMQSTLNAPPSGADSVSEAALPGQFLAELLATDVNEIAGYLFNPEIYNKIQARMVAGLNRAAQLGDSIVIASHSLGTVVAFDALRAVGAQYHISTLFTLGSPLAKLRRLGNRSADLGAISYDHVGQWLNLYDTTDPIADALGPAFPSPGYRLRDVFVGIATAPLPAHNYFPNSEVLAEIAKALR